MEKTIRLNKYLAHAGIANRRKADELIAEGLVSVNGEVVTEAGCKVSFDDEVKYMGQIVNPEKKVYLILNKPKKFATNSVLQEGKRDVMDIVNNAGTKAGLDYLPSIQPSDNFDILDTGLLIFSNDKDFLAKTKKSLSVFKIFTEESLSESDLKLIEKSLNEEHDNAEVKDIQFPEYPDTTLIGIESYGIDPHHIQNALNQLKINSLQTDRVLHGLLTKKDLPRGKWRFMTDKEINSFKIGL
jgi:23S rRNA pseudouridine2605 synthase